MHWMESTLREADNSKLSVVYYIHFNQRQKHIMLDVSVTFKSETVVIHIISRVMSYMFLCVYLLFVKPK